MKLGNHTSQANSSVKTDQRNVMKTCTYIHKIRKLNFTSWFTSEKRAASLCDLIITSWCDIGIFMTIFNYMHQLLLMLSPANRPGCLPRLSYLLSWLNHIISLQVWHSQSVNVFNNLCDLPTLIRHCPWQWPCLLQVWNISIATNLLFGSFCNAHFGALPHWHRTEWHELSGDHLASKIDCNQFFKTLNQNIKCPFTYYFMAWEFIYDSGLWIHMFVWLLVTY